MTDQMKAKIQEVAAFAEMIPGVVVIHEVKEFRLRFMSETGLRLLGKQWEEVDGLTGAEYHDRFFHPEFNDHQLPLILGLIENNTEETVSFFQQVRTGGDGEWDWYMSMLKILMRDFVGNPSLTITVAMKIDPSHYFTAKMAKVMKENQFLRDNHQHFSSLTKREREVLKLLAMGESSPAVAKQLSISVGTAETHRKNIKQKLKAKTNIDLMRYAQAFDLL